MVICQRIEVLAVHLVECLFSINDINELDFESPKTVKENGNANYIYEIVSATDISFKARAEAITDFDGDGVLNVWEIDENGNPKQLIKD